MDDPDCFPNVDHFMRALQDPAETSRARKHGAKSGGGTAPAGDSTVITTSSDEVIVYPKQMKALRSSVQRTLQAKYAGHFGIPNPQLIARGNLLLPVYVLRRIGTKLLYLTNSESMLLKALTHCL